MFAGNSANTQPELAERFLKLGKFCSETCPTFRLVTKLCRFLAQVSGSSSIDWLSSLLQTIPARLPSWSIQCIRPHGAMAWHVSYLWASVSRREAGWVLERCLGSPGRRREERGAGSSMGVRRPGTPGWESPFIINHRHSWALQLLAARGAGGHFTTGRGKLLWLFSLTRCQIFPSLFKRLFSFFRFLGC